MNQEICTIQTNQRSRYLRFLLLIFTVFLSIHSVKANKQEWDGKLYSDTALLQEKWADNFFIKHFNALGNEKILDIGSGDGQNTYKIAHLVPFGEVIGIDKSHSMIETARSRTKSSENVRFELRDAQDPTFFENHKEYFDVVTSFVTLHWIKDQNKVLKNIFLTLKPGGYAYISLCSKNFDPIQEIADRKIHEVEWVDQFRTFENPIHRFSEKDYEVLCLNNNFEIIEIKDARYEDQIHSRSDLEKQISSWLPHYAHLRNKAQTQATIFLQQVSGEYMKHYYPSENGKIKLIDHYLHIILKKPLR
jgi:ubiquinone/menaquinone biosynthesis C-methylase UbiE